MGASGSDRTAARQRRAMRARPPEATLAWLLTAVDATEVLRVDAMRGGSTSAMHRVVQEITALELVARSPVPTPQLLAADPHGRDTDAPTVVMSFLDGAPTWQPRRRRD